MLRGCSLLAKTKPKLLALEIFLILINAFSEWNRQPPISKAWVPWSLARAKSNKWQKNLQSHTGTTFLRTLGCWLNLVAPLVPRWAQMSSLSVSQPCFAFVALLLWVSNQHLGFYIDLLVDCEMKIKMRRKASSEGRLSFSYHSFFVRSSRVYPGLLHTQHPAGRIVPVWARGKIKYGLPWWQWWLREISVTN